MPEPYYCSTDEDSRDWEITYHRRTQTQPTKIHLKRSDGHGGEIYNQLPLDRLRDPTTQSEFPIPLFRIQIPNVDPYKDYKPSPKEHIVVDLEDCNVAEFFLVPASFDYKNFSYKWPLLSLHFLVASFQSYAATGLIIDLLMHIIAYLIMYILYDILCAFVKCIGCVSIINEFLLRMVVISMEARRKLRSKTSGWRTLAAGISGWWTAG